MKCIHCGHTTNYKVRQENGGRCEDCKHLFAFEPKDDPHTIGDPLFARAIQNVSSDNTLFFTPRQLWYEIERRLWRRRVSDSSDGLFGAGFIALGISALIAWGSESFVPVIIGLAVLGLLLVAGVIYRIIQGRLTPNPIMTHSQFRSSYLQKWVDAHGELKKLASSNGQRRVAPALTNLNTAALGELMNLPISRQTARNIFEQRSKGQVFEKLEDLLEVSGIEENMLEALRSRLEFPSASGEQEESPQTPGDENSQVSLFESESDLTQYSFDRALITDSADVVDMLVANNFHFENNCAVLSVDGYPSDIFETVLTMLRRNEKLTVFALHDASLGGCTLPVTLRGDRWFPDSTIRIIDLGLRPQHAQKLRVFRLQGNRTAVPEELSRMLAPKEVDWLSKGYSADVEVLRPERVMRAIYVGFARANLPGSKEKLEGEESETLGTMAADTVYMDPYYFGSMGDYGSGADVYASDSFG